MRVPGEQRREVEQRIRAAAAGLLAGNIPPGGHCDITTLARQACPAPPSTAAIPA